MQRVRLSETFTMSRIVYGMWRIADASDTGPAHVAAKINACLDHGITTFDQADIYGGYTAEEVLGNALRAHPNLRQKMEIVTKCGIIAPIGKFQSAEIKHYDTSGPHLNRSVDASLKNMSTDYVDLLLIHRPDPFMDHHRTGAALDALVASGKVRNVGVSNFRPWDWDLLQSAMTNKLVTNQIEFSLNASKALTNGDLAFHQGNG